MNAEIIIRIDKPGSTATLTIPPAFDPKLVSRETIIAIASDAGVLIDDRVIRVIDEFVVKHTPSTEPVDLLITSVPPENGSDGWIEWSEGFDPANPTSTRDENGRADYYHGQDYVRVNAGDVVGRMHQPTDGRDGRDVRGRVLKACPGKQCPIKVHSGLDIDENGDLRANAGGVLIINRDLLEVSQQLDIHGCVDFSTGNIDYCGAVKIDDAIRSGFKVKAETDIQVGGLIEDAKIICGGSLIARRGMAGKLRGHIDVGGDVDATYLEEVLGKVQGDLRIRSGVIGCELTVGGSIRCPTGVIRGGTLHVSGAFEAEVLGSESSTPTRVHLAGISLGPKTVEKETEKSPATNGPLNALIEEKASILLIKNPSNAQRERITEIIFEIQELEEAMAEEERQAETLRRNAESNRTLDVLVKKQIHSGVTLVIDGIHAKFIDPVQGPLTIRWNASRDPVCSINSGESQPLSRIAKISAGPNATDTTG